MLLRRLVGWPRGLPSADDIGSPRGCSPRGGAIEGGADRHHVMPLMSAAMSAGSLERLVALGEPYRLIIFHLCRAYFRRAAAHGDLHHGRSAEILTFGRFLAVS